MASQSAIQLKAQKKKVELEQWLGYATSVIHLLEDAGPRNSTELY